MILSLFIHKRCITALIKSEDSETFGYEIVDPAAGISLH